MTERQTLAALILLATLAGCGRAPPPPAPASGDPASGMPAVVAIGDAEATASIAPTASLGESIAARYGVTRERGRVLVLVGLSAGDGARPATVTGQARDLRGVAQGLVFREVRTGGRIEYVATARATPPDTLRFDLDIESADGQRARLRFSRDLRP